jgi:hypothetical protein
MATPPTRPGWTVATRLSDYCRSIWSCCPPRAATGRCGGGPRDRGYGERAERRAPLCAHRRWLTRVPKGHCTGPLSASLLGPSTKASSTLTTDSSPTWLGLVARLRKRSGNCRRSRTETAQADTPLRKLELCFLGPSRGSQRHDPPSPVGREGTALFSIPNNAFPGIRTGTVVAVWECLAGPLA